MESHRHIFNLVLKAVEDTKELATFDISFELYNTSTRLPQIVPSYGNHIAMDLMIDLHMLNLVFAKQTVDRYKKLFPAILSKVYINSLYIQMMGRLPILLGVLGAVARKLAPRPYKLLIILLGGVFTCNAGLSPFWEVFGEYVKNIIRYTRPTGDGGLLTMSEPSEFLTNLTQREEILGMGREEYRGGSLRLSSERNPR